jgi:N-acetyl sugar amidotransferase
MKDKAQSRKGANIFRPDVRYQICVQCINDTSDPEISFDEKGVCNHCKDYVQELAEYVFPPPEGHQKLAMYLAQIKAEGRGKRYDCILGLSGGVDSSYVAYLTKKFGLRPLAVHVDNGWNSEAAVRNIENIVTTLGIDLHTNVLDWEEFRNLQLAFLRASTPDSEIPSDHAIVATLYKLCEQEGIRWIMDGSNVVTEAMLPKVWSHGHTDYGYISGLNKQFSPTPLKTYSHYTHDDLHVKYWGKLKIERFPILNFVDYNKKKVIEVLKNELSWQPYGGKHYESIYTRFYQGYIMPKKFGFDKRRGHLSCLILDKQITRDEALAEMQRPALDEELAAQDREFVIKKLGIDSDEFDRIMAAERKTFWDYPSDERDLRRMPPSREVRKKIREKDKRKKQRNARLHKALRQDAWVSNTAAALANLPLAKMKRVAKRTAVRSAGAVARAGLKGLKLGMPEAQYAQFESRFKASARRFLGR